MAQQPQQWFYRKGNEKFGPISSAELKKKTDSGEILPTDLLKMVGLSDWIPASNIKGLFPTPEPAKPEPPKPKPVAKPTTTPTPTAKPGSTQTTVQKPAQKPVQQPGTPTTVGQKPAASKPGTSTPQKSGQQPAVSKPGVQTVSRQVASKPAAPVRQPPQAVAPTPFGAAHDPFAAANTNPFGNAPNPFGSASDPFTAANPNPFGNAPDPFGAAPDPFAAASPNPFGNSPNPFGAAPMGGGFDMSNLVALEKQGQAIAQPAPVASGEPLGKKTSAPSSKGRGSSREGEESSPYLKIGFLVAPFAVMSVLGFFAGCICVWIPFWYLCIAYAVFVSKAVGLLAGNCMLKAKVKGEIVSLGYGALLGFFVAYLFVAATFWSWFNVFAMGSNYAARQAERAAAKEIRPAGVDEEGRSTELRPDEPPMTMEDIERRQAEADAAAQAVKPAAMDGAADPQNAVNAAIDKDEEDEEEADGVGPAFSEADRKRFQNENRAFQERMEMVERLFGKGVSVAESVSPYYLGLFCKHCFGVRAAIYWLIMFGVLIAVTAHSTWMSNLGHDPTSNSAF